MPPFLDPPGCARHGPESTLLHQLVEQHYPAFREQCHAEKLIAFSCTKRGFCPSCGARRMAESAALLADEVLPERPLRQRVLSLPHARRFLLATNPAALTQVLGVVYQTIARYLISQAGLTRTRAATGAVTLIQRFGSALNLNIHFHMLFLDGVYLFKGAHPPLFRPVAGPSANELQRLVEQVGAQVSQVLERRGLIERDIENAWLAGDFEADAPERTRLANRVLRRAIVSTTTLSQVETLQGQFRVVREAVAAELADRWPGGPGR